MSVITKLTSAFAQSHILGMMMDIYNMIPAGGVCYFADKNALKGTLLENIQHYRWISSLLEQIWYPSTQTNAHCGSSKSVGEDRGGDQVQGVIAGAKKDGPHHHHHFDHQPHEYDHHNHHQLRFHHPPSPISLSPLWMLTNREIQWDYICLIFFGCWECCNKKVRMRS